MLRIVKRQAIEELAKDLAIVVNQPADVFAHIPIIVPSMAMGDWLNNYLAERNGISALTESHFFGMMQWTWVEEVTGEKAFQPHAPLSMSGIHWQLFAWLYANGRSILQNNQHPLHKLLSVLFEGNDRYEDGAIARLWTLSEQFARIFVRYITLRPSWLEHWHRGEKLPIETMLANQKAMPDWLQRHYHQVHDTQRYLWQLLFADIYQAREQRVANFWQILAQESSKVSLLPEQIIIFTLQGMTPDMIRFIEQLSQYVDVTLYHFAPTYQMIDDIVDAKWLQRYHIEHVDAQDAHFDAGHTLVSRFGKQARDQARLLTQIDEHGQSGQLKVVIDEQTTTHSKTTLLGILQQEIHDLDSAAPSRDYFKLLDEQNRFQEDNSLSVHACHGLFRQLEVLRAEIVHWLNEDTHRQLSDILVVLPEIGDEQALIRAVFPPDGRYDGLTLPARLTGVTAPETMNLWLALSGYFTLLERQFNAREVADWLTLDENINALGLSTDEMQRAIHLIQEAGFKRGFDEAHLQETLAPDDEDYRFSFTYALDRLVVGLLMPEVAHYHDSVPIPHITMADTNSINALTTVAEIINRIRAQQSRNHDVYEWLALIESVLVEYFPFAEHTQSYVVIQQSITDLRYQLYAQDTLLKEVEQHPLPLAFVLNYIEKGLADRQVSSEPSGVITIGRLNALRSLPYKLIAFLNVNMDDFPSTGMDDRYDLTTIDKRQDGDQIKEEDDLSAFLDLLLSATENCWFFYDRYKPEDTNEHLPSILLQELLDHLSAHCVEPKQAQQRFIIKHPQNPFDENDAIGSVVPLWQNIQQKLAKGDASKKQPQKQHDVPTFDMVFNQPPSEQQGEVIALNHIIYDLTHPAKTFAHSQGLDFLSEVEVVDTFEPLSAGSLLNYGMTDFFIANHLNATPMDIITIKRLPTIPAGAYGEVWFEKSYREFDETLQALLAFAKVENLSQTYPQQIRTNYATISANVPLANQLGPWVMMSAGKQKDKHLLRAWLHHILWSILRAQRNERDISIKEQRADGLRGCAVVQFYDELVIFEPLTLTQAQSYLEDWLAVWRYLTQQLWFAPIELLFKVYQESIGKDGTKRLERLRKYCQSWLSDSEHNRFYKIDNEEIWRHLSKDYAEDELLEYICTFVDAYAERLVSPIYIHQRSAGETDES